jgi:cysteine desulfuration protein SufE
MKKGIDEIQDQIIEEMAAREGWMAKYEYLIVLGEDLPSPGEEFKTWDNALGGCQSSVWLTAELKENLIFFRADSDSVIVRGMLALLLRTLNGQPPEEVAASDL